MRFAKIGLHLANGTHRHSINFLTTASNRFLFRCIRRVNVVAKDMYYIHTKIQSEADQIITATSEEVITISRRGDEQRNSKIKWHRKCVSILSKSKSTSKTIVPRKSSNIKEPVRITTNTGSIAVCVSHPQELGMERKSNDFNDIPFNQLNISKLFYEISQTKY